MPGQAAIAECLGAQDQHLIPGHGVVHVVAGLGAAEEPHFPPNVIQQPQKYRRKKTPGMEQLTRQCLSIP